MASTLTLNCITLGKDLDPMDFFPVSIDASSTFNDLRNNIFPSTDIITLSQTKLFQLRPHISITDDQFSEKFAQAVGSMERLLPTLTISSRFSEQLHATRLHLVVQTPCVLHLHFSVVTNKVSRVYPISIDSMQHIPGLQTAIALIIKDDFRHIGDLKIWKVSLLNDESLTERLKRVISDKKTALSGQLQLINVFPFTLENHLDMVVEAGYYSLTLRCWAYHMEPLHYFPVEVRNTDDVRALKAMIKAMNPSFNSIFELWAVSIRVDDHFLSAGWNGDRTALSDSYKISDIFQNVDENCINVFITGALFGGYTDSFDKKRQACVERFKNITPSQAAKLDWLKPHKSPLKEDIICHRPEALEVPPITLLHQMFGKLTDDMNGIIPGKSDYEFADNLSESMSEFFATEADRVRKFNKIFEDHGLKIADTKIDDTTIASDGGPKHHHLHLIIAAGKNEPGMTDSDSFFQVLFYYCRRLASSYERNGHAILRRSRRPSVLILYNGKWLFRWQNFCDERKGPFLGIAGAVFTEHVQCEMLVPVLPLFWNRKSPEPRTQLARALAGVKRAVEYVKKLYPGGQISPQESFSHGYPYPWMYNDLKTNEPHTFTYDSIQPYENRLLFCVRLANNAKLYVKFVKRYGKQAHEFCAERGRAPKLFGFKQLEGGWFMVVMECLQDFHGWDNEPKAAQESLRVFISEYHRNGFVHGDLRRPNILISNSDCTDFKLIDFDWAGQYGAAHYPSMLNPAIQWPTGVEIHAQIEFNHDIEMLDLLFLLESDADEVARRLQSSMRFGSSVPSSESGEA